jgi:DNA polymerase V
MRTTLYALVDCSAFYCSCERVFRPDIAQRPVCVLSNNDGCVVSLTPEMKALGIRMGTPLFQIKDEIKKHKALVFSSNYSLYADMSRRVVQAIETFSDDVEQYSIDESFIAFGADDASIVSERERLQALAEDIYNTVLRETGIPVRVSIAETKTLAKVGSLYTKQLLKEGKIPCSVLWHHPEKQLILSTTPVSEVWGVGRALTEKLVHERVGTAAQLAALDSTSIRKRYGIVLEKTVHELNGICCIPLDEHLSDRKSIIRSRMFSKKLTDPSLICEAVIAHTVRSAEKLRSEKLLATQLTVYICTSRHVESRVYRSVSRALVLPTNDSFVLSALARTLFEECFIAHSPSGAVYRYSKAGIVLHELIPETAFTAPLFSGIQKEQPLLMAVLDKMNKKFGKNSVALASMGTPDTARKTAAGKSGARDWAMKREHMSPRYTTVWSELVRVKL